MRTLAALALLLLVSSATIAQEAQTPRESFEAFVAAVLDTTLTEEQRTAAFERYFDFDTWLKDREAEVGKTYSAEERAELQEGWYNLFRSAEFRDSYSKRNVRVTGEPAIDREAGTATLPIAMDGEGGEDRFEVRMKLSADGSHWRWHAIPQVEGKAMPTLAERLKAAEDSLAQVEVERRRLETYAFLLREEIARMRAELVEAGANESPYSSPQSVVTAAWRAIEKGDAEALLACHTTAQVAKSKLEEVKAGISRTRERLMEWQVLAATIDEKDPARAIVPVKLKLRRTGEVDERTVSVRVLKVGEEWKIDEAP